LPRATVPLSQTPGFGTLGHPGQLSHCPRAYGTAILPGITSVPPSNPAFHLKRPEHISDMAAEPAPSPLQRSVAFTGRLASMKREGAFALVRKQGGTPRRGLTKKTAILVVGELGWPLLPDGKPSKSLSLAKSFGIAVASERQFLEWAGKAIPSDQ